MNQAITELEFLMGNDEGMDDFTSVYAEIVHHARTTGDYELLRSARELLMKQIAYLSSRYKEEMPEELAEYARSIGMMDCEVSEN